MNSLHYGPDQVTHAFEINRKFQASQQFPCLGLGHLGNGAGRGVINLPLDLVQLFFALPHRQKSDS